MLLSLLRLCGHVNTGHKYCFVQHLRVMWFWAEVNLSTKTPIAAGDVKRLDCPENSWKGVSGMGEMLSWDPHTVQIANCTQWTLQTQLSQDRDGVHTQESPRQMFHQECPSCCIPSSHPGLWTQAHLLQTYFAIKIFKEGGKTKNTWLFLRNLNLTICVFSSK